MTLERHNGMSYLTCALRAMGILGYMTPASLQMTTLAVHLRSVLKGVLDKSMIKDLRQGTIATHAHL